MLNATFYETGVILMHLNGHGSAPYALMFEIKY